MDWTAPEGMDEYLSPTVYCDSDCQLVRKAAHDIIEGSRTPKAAALRVFAFVRDKIPFALDEHAKASDTLRRGNGQCTTKTGLQIALLRAVGIPARYHVTDVHKNSLRGLISPEAFDVFDDTVADHPWCECYLSGRWLSCETLFDKALYGAGVGLGIISKDDIATIDWDGASDLVMLTSWVLKDKGTTPSIDDLIDLERPGFVPVLPVLRQSNEHTMRVRTRRVT